MVKRPPHFGIPLLGLTRERVVPWHRVRGVIWQSFTVTTPPIQPLGERLPWLLADSLYRAKPLHALGRPLDQVPAINLNNLERLVY